ncbi:unnamed protein product [Choristocarpus tenellus]
MDGDYLLAQKVGGTMPSRSRSHHEEDPSMVMTDKECDLGFVPDSDEYIHGDQLSNKVSHIMNSPHKQDFVDTECNLGWSNGGVGDLGCEPGDDLSGEGREAVLVAVEDDLEEQMQQDTLFGRDEFVPEPDPDWAFGNMGEGLCTRPNRSRSRSFYEGDDLDIQADIDASFGGVDREDRQRHRNDSMDNGCLERDKVLGVFLSNTSRTGALKPNELIALQQVRFSVFFCFFSVFSVFLRRCTCAVARRCLLFSCLRKTCCRMEIYIFFLKKRKWKLKIGKFFFKIEEEGDVSIYVIR